MEDDLDYDFDPLAITRFANEDVEIENPAKARQLLRKAAEEAFAVLRNYRREGAADLRAMRDVLSAVIDEPAARRRLLDPSEGDTAFEIWSRLGKLSLAAQFPGGTLETPLRRVIDITGCEPARTDLLVMESADPGSPMHLRAAGTSDTLCGSFIPDSWAGCAARGSFRARAAMPDDDHVIICLSCADWLRALPSDDPTRIAAYETPDYSVEQLEFEEFYRSLARALSSHFASLPEAEFPSALALDEEAYKAIASRHLASWAVDRLLSFEEAETLRRLLDLASFANDRGAIVATSDAGADIVTEAFAEEYEDRIVNPAVMRKALIAKVLDELSNTNLLAARHEFIAAMIETFLPDRAGDVTRRFQAASPKSS